MTAIRVALQRPPGPAAPGHSCPAACRCGRSPAIVRQEANDPTEGTAASRLPRDPGARRERDHRRRRAFMTAATAAVTTAGPTAPSILTRTPPARAISIRPGAGSSTGPAAGSDITATGTSPAAGVDRASSSPPFEQLVGVDVVPPRHDRDRRTRLERLGHELTLQRFRPPPTLATRLLGVRFTVSRWGGWLPPPRPRCQDGAEQACREPAS